MFDILDFIDSKDIREYNKNTFFYPIEKAVLINASIYTSVEKKLAAWKELLDTYNEAQFEERATIDYFEHEKRTNPSKTVRSKRSIVADTVEQYELALKQCDEITPHIVYKANLHETDQPDTTQLFSSYQNAYCFIKDTIEENDKTKYTEIAIDSIKLDSDITDDCVCRYRFHVIKGTLEMTWIWREDSVDYEDWGLDSFFVNVPLPFQKGDIVKLIYPDELYAYGVVEDDMKTFFPSQKIKFRDGSDMCLWPYTFIKKENGYRVYDPDIPFLHFELCSRDELPQEQAILADFSDVCLGKMGIGYFLMQHFSL